ncbi:unnamed protein product [Urochloa humidicola]
MLSLRGARREDAGSRGRGVADDAEELEEGEARSDSDSEGFLDPDVALSYICSGLRQKFVELLTVSSLNPERR